MQRMERRVGRRSVRERDDDNGSVDKIKFYCGGGGAGSTFIVASFIKKKV